MLKIKVLFIFLAMFVGGFSIQHLIPYYEFLGVFGGVRYWVTVLICLLLFAEAAQKGKLTLHKSNTKLWFVLFCMLHGYLLISPLWSEAPVQVFMEEIPDIVLLVLLILQSVYTCAESPRDSIRIILSLFLWTSGFLTLVGIVAFGSFTGDMLDIGIGGIGNARIQSTGILAAVYFWINTSKLYWLIPVPVFAINIFLSGSRAAALALLVSLCVLILLTWRRVSMKKKALTVFTVVVLFAAALQVPAFEKAMLEFLSSVWTSNENVSQLYLADRDIIFSQAWGLFLQYPLTGLGFGGYRLFSLTGEVYPHNLILNIVDDVGMLGLLLFAFLICMLGTRWLRTKTLENKVALSAGIFYFTASMFAGTYYDARFMWLFFLLYMMSDSQNENQAGKRVKV